MRGYELDNYLSKVDIIADDLVVNVNKNMGECIRLINNGFTMENGQQVVAMCEELQDNLISIINELKVLKQN